MAAVTDASGTLIAEQRYLPFGEERQDVGTIAQTDFGYTGQRDLGMGLMDYKARFYSPGLGRFMQPDTLIPEPANPQAWNRYGYTQNNPIRYSDPTGHDRCDGDNSYRCQIHRRHQDRENAEFDRQEAEEAARNSASNLSSKCHY